MYVFPLKPGSKFPMKGFEWRRLSSNDPDIIARWAQDFPGCNWAIDCGKSGLSVLDVDCHNGKPGKASLLDIEMEHDIPDTLIISSYSGGLHYYFKGVTSSRIGVMPGIDIKSDGGYVLMAGSVIDGKPYTVLKQADVVDTPSWMTTLAGEVHERDPLADTPLCEYDLPHNVYRARKFLGNHPRVESGTRGSTILKVAYRLRDMGISEDMATILIEEGLHIEGLDSWDETIEHQVKKAYVYAKGRAGVDTDEHREQLCREVFKVLPDTDTLWKPFSWYRQHIAPPVEWVVENWIPAGYSAPTLFTGDGGTGKSMLGLQLGVSVAAGIDFLGVPTTQMAVCMVMCEDSDDEISRRIQSICRNSGYAFTPEEIPFHVISRTGESAVMCYESDNRLLKGEFFDILDKQLGRIEGPKLLMLDTAADILAANENSRPIVNQFVKHYLVGLAAKHECTLVVIAHPPKQEGSTYSGSTAWNNSFRNRLFLDWHTPKKRDDFRALSREKSNYAKAGETISLKYNAGVFDLVTEAEIFEGNASRILEEIDSAWAIGAPLSLSPQAPRYIGKVKIVDTDGAEIPSGMVRDIINQLLSDGQIEQIKGQKHMNGLRRI